MSRSPSSEPLDEGELARPKFLDARGDRLKVEPDEVKGRFVRWRRIAYAILIAIYVAAPFLRIGGRPAVHLDIEARRFWLLGRAFNAQDAWILVLLLAAFAFSLVFVTALAGRVWCGWACPQTVLMEGVFRPIERLLEGPAWKRRRTAAGGWTGRRIAVIAVKQVIFLLIAAALAHWFLAFFVPLPQLAQIVVRGPAGHTTLFFWAMALTALVWFDFAWFREQLCIIVCPYGRLQSVLTDRQSLTIGYDALRGEPRGKKGATTGDCVDCLRCVRVCPTDIDIRDGQQLECIGCAQCIDACDDVMDRLGRARGLIRYDSLAGLEREPRKLWRPRLFAYAVPALAAVTAVVVDVAALRTPFEANLLRARGTTYTLEGASIRNQFELHLVNKHPEPAEFEIEVEAPAAVSVVVPQPRVKLGPLEDLRQPIFVTVPREHFRGGFQFELKIEDAAGGREKELEGRFLGPPAAPPAG